MIISCEKCDKKFEISDNLIPDGGRTLQCGSCSYKWHYIPKDKNQITEKDQKIIKESINEKKIPIKNSTTAKETIIKENKSIGFLSYLLVLIISFIAFIIIIETFKSPISLYIPSIDFYISSLHESIKDILLFLKDLIK